MGWSLVWKVSDRWDNRWSWFSRLSPANFWRKGEENWLVVKCRFYWLTSYQYVLPCILALLSWRHFIKKKSDGKKGVARGEIRSWRTDKRKRHLELGCAMTNRQFHILGFLISRLEGCRLGQLRKLAPVKRERGGGGMGRGGKERGGREREAQRRSWEKERKNEKQHVKTDEKRCRHLPFYRVRQIT